MKQFFSLLFIFISLSLFACKYLKDYRGVTIRKNPIYTIRGFLDDDFNQVVFLYKNGSILLPDGKICTWQGLSELHKQIAEKQTLRYQPSNYPNCYVDGTEWRVEDGDWTVPDKQLVQITSFTKIHGRENIFLAEDGKLRVTDYNGSADYYSVSISFLCSDQTTHTLVIDGVFDHDDYFFVNGGDLAWGWEHTYHPVGTHELCTDASLLPSFFNTIRSESLPRSFIAMGMTVRYIESDHSYALNTGEITGTLSNRIITLSNEANGTVDASGFIRLDRGITGTMDTARWLRLSNGMFGRVFLNNSLTLQFPITGEIDFDGNFTLSNGMTGVFHSSENSFLIDNAVSGTISENGEISFTNGMIGVLEGDTLKLITTRGWTSFDVLFNGFSEIRNAPQVPHMRKIGKDNSIEIQFENGTLVPFPAAPAVLLTPKTAPDSDDPAQETNIKYVRAELWYKVLPDGAETDQSVWHLASSVLNDNLQLNALNAPVRLFERVQINELKANDEVLFLLYLVDENGTASGETMTEGAREPVISLPDKSTLMLNASPLDGAEFAGTLYTSPYLIRVKFNGKKALK